MKSASIAALIIAALMAFPAHTQTADGAAFVAAHNKWRADAGVTAKMSYSPALAVSAQAWADHLKQTGGCAMTHSKPDGKYGENLFWASALQWSDGRRQVAKVSPAQVVDDWGSEKADYDYAANRCTPGKMCGHYTQIVWSTTQTVGCGVAVCNDSREQVWVCRYQPAGNWVGRKPY